MQDPFGRESSGAFSKHRESSEISSSRHLQSCRERAGNRLQPGARVAHAKVQTGTRKASEERSADSPGFGGLALAFRGDASRRNPGCAASGPSGAFHFGAPPSVSRRHRFTEDHQIQTGGRLDGGNGLTAFRMAPASSRGHEANAWVFPSENGKTTLERDAVWRRNIQPALARIKLGCASFQVLRRTYATLSREAGVEAKTRADQMGRQVDVSENEYAVTNLAAKLEAGRKL